MKTSLFRLLPVVPLMFAALHGADEKMLAALRAADAERMAAMTAGDQTRLEAIFSDQLHYVHSSGKVDSKASFIDTLVNHRTVYESFAYTERTFTPMAEDVVLMTGRVWVHLLINGSNRIVEQLGFLAVWRQEKGQWRFIGWHSGVTVAPTLP